MFRIIAVPMKSTSSLEIQKSTLKSRNPEIHFQIQKSTFKSRHPLLKSRNLFWNPKSTWNPVDFEISCAVARRCRPLGWYSRGRWRSNRCSRECFRICTRERSHGHSSGHSHVRLSKLPLLIPIDDAGTCTNLSYASWYAHATLIRSEVKSTVLLSSSLLSQLS